MNRDLFLAILAMDSYSRGYGQRMSGLTATGNLGAAAIKFDSLVLGGTPEDRADATADFYAIAYEWGGETIISYRGTDGLNDILTGWTVGAGWTDQAQANLANDNHFTDWRNAA